MLKGAIGIEAPNGVQMPITPNAQSGGGMGQAQKNAQKATMSSYGERLAQRAKPDMNNG
jgi:hypothetical protein